MWQTGGLPVLYPITIVKLRTQHVRRHLGTHQWQCTLLVVGLPVTHDWFKMGCHLSPSLISIKLTCEPELPFVPYLHLEEEEGNHNNNNNITITAERQITELYTYKNFLQSKFTYSWHSTIAITHREMIIYIFRFLKSAQNFCQSLSEAVKRWFDSLEHDADTVRVCLCVRVYRVLLFKLQINQIGKQIAHSKCTKHTGIE